MEITFAVVQFEVAQFQPEVNLEKAERFIQQAVNAGAQIIVFPEDFVTGPVVGRFEYVDREGRYRRHFQDLASRYRIDIVPGSIIEGDEQGLFNTTYYIDRAGAIRGRYRKVNLWLPERSYIAAGAEFPVFETAYGRVGLQICWDLNFPEGFRQMARQGVEIVICPSYWCFEDAGVGLRHNPQSEVEMVNALCVARAFENEIVLVYANAAGEVQWEHGRERLIGQSQITVPFKGRLNALAHTHEGMFLQRVDTALLHDAELAYEIRKDLRERL